MLPSYSRKNSEDFLDIASSLSSWISEHGLSVIAALAQIELCSSAYMEPCKSYLNPCKTIITQNMKPP